MKLLNFIKQILDSENILIYQMGKVGSTSLEKSIINSDHFHTLYNKKACEFYNDISNLSLKNKIKSFIINKLKVFLLKRRKTIKIITLVRDPYKRNISHYFQDLQFWLSYYTIINRETTRTNSSNIVIDCFEKYYNFEYSNSWFENEIERFTKIKIDECHFDINKGYGITKKGKYELLILRMDKLNNLNKEISDFIGYNIEIKKDNSTEEKWYLPLYKTFINEYKPSKETIENSFKNNWVEIFYTEEEIIKMKNILS